MLFYIAGVTMSSRFDALIRHPDSWPFRNTVKFILRKAAPCPESGQLPDDQPYLSYAISGPHSLAKAWSWVLWRHYISADAWTDWCKQTWDTNGQMVPVLNILLLPERFRLEIEYHPAVDDVFRG